MCFIYLSSNVVITLVLKFQSQYFSYGAVSTQIIHDFIQCYFRLFVHYLFRPSVCSVVPSVRVFKCSGRPCVQLFRPSVCSVVRLWYRFVQSFICMSIMLSIHPFIHLFIVWFIRSRIRRQFFRSFVYFLCILQFSRIHLFTSVCLWFEIVNVRMQDQDIPNQP